MTTPSVSIVCTFYNKAPYVSTVLNSIKNQRGLNEVEYILVDDGSTDNTLDLLYTLTKGWENCRIIAQANGGQTSATITGLQLARNDYIKTWDGDDYGHPELTARLIKACETFNVSYAYSRIDGGPDVDPDNYEYLSQWLEKLPVSEPILQKIQLRKVLHSPKTNPTGSIFKRTLMDKVMPDPRIVIPDIYMSYAASLFTDFAHIESKLAYAFNNVPGRLTSNDTQIMHDLNGALACLYDNYYDTLPYRIKIFICRRATGRARLWARRRYKQGLFTSLYGHLALRSFIPIPMKKIDIFRACGAFRQKQAKVRTGPGMVEL
jgi:glycosyltransferase involved in cell wall biosynthesis